MDLGDHSLGATKRSQPPARKGIEQPPHGQSKIDLAPEPLNAMLPVDFLPVPCHVARVQEPACRDRV
jgi:hypothetical protein